MRTIDRTYPQALCHGYTEIEEGSMFSLHNFHTSYSNSKGNLMQYPTPKKKEKKENPPKLFTKEIFETVLKATTKPCRKEKVGKEG